MSGNYQWTCGAAGLEPLRLETGSLGGELLVKGGNGWIFGVRPERKEQRAESCVMVWEKKLLWLHWLARSSQHLVKAWLAGIPPDCSLSPPGYRGCSYLWCLGVLSPLNQLLHYLQIILFYSVKHVSWTLCEPVRVQVLCGPGCTEAPLWVGTVLA